MQAAFETSTFIKEYFQDNRDYFQEQLLSEAVNVRDKIEEILLIGNIDLLNNAQKLVVFVMDQSTCFSQTRGNCMGDTFSDIDVQA